MDAEKELIRRWKPYMYNELQITANIKAQRIGCPGQMERQENARMIKLVVRKPIGKSKKEDKKWVESVKEDLAWKNKAEDSMRKNS